KQGDTHPDTDAVHNPPGGTQSTTRPITVRGNGAPNGTIDLPASDVSITAGQSVSFAATGVDPYGDAMTYAWSFGGGAAAATVEDPGAVVFATAGTYTV